MSQTVPESEPESAEPDQTPEEDGGPERDVIRRSHRITSDPREAAGVPLEAESSNLTEPDEV